MVAVALALAACGGPTIARTDRTQMQMQKQTDGGTEGPRAYALLDPSCGSAPAALTQDELASGKFKHPYVTMPPACAPPRLSDTSVACDAAHPCAVLDNTVIARVPRGSLLNRLVFIDRRIPIVLIDAKTIAQPGSDKEWSLTRLPEPIWYITGRADAAHLYDSAVLDYRFGPEGLRAASAKEPLDSPYFAQDAGGCLEGVIEREGMHHEIHRIRGDDTIACVHLPDGASPAGILTGPDGTTSVLLDTGNGGPQRPSRLFWARSGATPMRLQVGRAFEWVTSAVDARGSLALMMRAIKDNGADLVVGTAQSNGQVSMQVVDHDQTTRTCRHVAPEGQTERDECTLHETKLYPAAMHVARDGVRFAYNRIVVDAREVCTDHQMPCDPGGPGPDPCRNNRPQRTCQRSDSKLQASLFLTDGRSTAVVVLPDSLMQAGAIGFDGEGRLHLVVEEVGESNPMVLHHVLIGPRT